VPRESTSPDSWSIRKLIAALEAGERNDSNAVLIKIPQFQRNIMWGAKKQEALIDSIHRGFPIGALMLYEKSSNDETKEYQLVDGLQRAFSIWQYKREPLMFFGLNRVGVELSAMIDSINEAVDDNFTIVDLNPIMENWKTETKTTNTRDGFDSYHLLNILKQEFSIPDELTSQIYDPTLNLLEAIKEKVNIDDQEIPIIVYEGDPKHLPDIFERINTGSVQLSKYQILAAQWVDVSVRTQQLDIIQSIQRKHQSLEEKGFRIDIWDDSRTESEFSLYEYLFGMGKVIAEKYPLLFAVKAPHEEESVAFALATVINQLPISKMSNINAKFREELGSLRLTEFFIACDDAASFVEEVLKPNIGLKLNTRKQSHAHSVNQIISMISRCVVGKYDPETWTIRDNWEAERQTLRRSLPQHYLADLLQRNWKGSGDSRLFTMTWKQTADEKYSPSNYYLTEFDKSRFEGILDNWFAAEIEKSEYKRATETAAKQVFLKFLYSPFVSFRDNFDKKYEIEHLFPVSRLIGALTSNNDDGWPINCVANLALFIDATNREKSNKTLVEYLNGLSQSDREEIDEQLEGMLFCDITDVTMNGNFSKSDYISFLETRYQKLKDTMISNLELEESTSQIETVPMNELSLEEENTFSERVDVSSNLSDIVVVPGSTFFTFGFNVPVDQQDPFISHFNLSRENLRVPIEIVIADVEYSSRIRVQFQPKRVVVQFNFLSDTKRELGRIFGQSYLDVSNNDLASEKCRISHLGENKFSLTKIFD